MSTTQIEYPLVADDNEELKPIEQPKVMAIGKVLEPQEKAPMTSAQAKVDAVAAITMKAYDRASMLQLTEQEIELLQAEFPDDAFQPGAAGKEHLIYIEHAHLRDRLNRVFRPGQWSIIPRNRWAEDFRTAKGYPASRVYVEAMLVIRGCFVAEAVGEMEYYPNNASQNYGDAVEGAKTAALRRCCKELGVGLQAWKKEWCEGWWARRHARAKKPTAAPAPTPQPTPDPAKPATKTRAEATPDQKAKLIAVFEKEGPTAVQAALGYFVDAGAILPTETLEALPLRWVPATQGEMRELGGLIAVWNIESKATRPSWLPPVERTPVEAPKPIEVPRESPTPEGDWHSFPMPWGKQAGVPLGELEKNYLFGLWANYKVETEYKGKPKKPETIAKDEEFRAMLDLAGAHYQFTTKG